MLFAFIADVASSPGLKIWDEGWDVEVDVSTEIKFGNISIRLATKFDSKQFSREPKDPGEVHRDNEARRKATSV